mmetsp:Transcript_29033/g.47137  ORF Transcript_29033/g.47137 Transcript_29033/m.47137 type:complete len:215 (+) Transcript_29033:42-686(+)
MKSAMASRGMASSPNFVKQDFASSVSRLASARAPSMPSSFTYVVLSTASSLPAVLPSSSEVCVQSRMSSATWKARPMSSANFSTRSTSSFEAPPKIAPLATATFSRAAVLCMWIQVRSSVVTPDLPSQMRSMAWPPASPQAPTLLPSRPITSSVRSAGTDFGVYLATCSKEVESMASPARMAMSSPYTTWLVGTPLRRSSLSIEGRSSWMRDIV